VKSELTKDFIRLFNNLPKNVKKNARKNYKLWKKDSSHPSLEFKKLKTKNSIYSVRISLGYRAIGIMKNNETIIWFWVGSHSNYDKLIKKLN
jgi:hypothetical protein